MISVYATDLGHVRHDSADGWHLDEGGRLHVRAADQEIAVYNAAAWLTVWRVQD